MWVRGITAKEIVNQIKETKQKGGLYHREILVDNCWSINITYSPFNKNELDGLEVTVLMGYKHGARAVARVWLYVNGQSWQYWYRLQDELTQVDRVDVYPIISNQDCTDMKLDKFQFARNIEIRLERLYKEYITEMIIKPKERQKMLKSKYRAAERV